MSPKAFVCTLLLVAGLAGCSSTPPLENASPNLTVVSEVPAPMPIDPVTGLPHLPLGPYDVISYEVLGIDNLSGEATVDAAGGVSIPLAGRVRAAGLTVEEFEREVVAALRRNYVRNPQVAINLKEMVSQQVTVEGSVTRPGSYPVLPQMTLMRTIASAQGLTEFARSSEVVVFRTVEGNRYATLYDLAAIRAGSYDDPVIYPQDIVVVSESRATRLFRDIMAAAPGVISPLAVLLTR